MIRRACSISCVARTSAAPATCFSTRLPMATISRAISCSSASKALTVCSGIALPSRRCSAETAGDVILGPLFARGSEYLVRSVEFDQLTEIHERGKVRDPRRLLHIMSHQDDRVEIGRAWCRGE